MLGLPRPRAFTRDVSAADVRAIPGRILGDNSVNDFDVILRAADADALRDPAVAALRRLVSRRRLRRRIGGLRPVVRLREMLRSAPGGERILRLVGGG